MLPTLFRSQWLSGQSYRVVRHVIFWALYIGFKHLTYQVSSLTWPFIIKDTVAAVLGFYFFSLVVLPHFVLRRRWILSALSLLAIYYTWALLSYATFAVVTRAGLVPPNWHEYVHRILDQGIWRGVFAWYGVSIGLYDFSVTVMMPILGRFVQFLLSTSNQTLRLQRENLNLEVNFLKAQVNPHFLFNTLNNIYTMVVKRDERAPDMVQHLSDLMHYTVYESNAAQVPLAKEIAFLEAYLELERLRYGTKVSITYQQLGLPDGLSVTPLLFFPFVENAFKHGVDSSLDASWVEIRLAVEGEQLHFSVRNSCSPGASKLAYGGVGITNVQKRLALHYSPADYQLTIQPSPTAYQVELILQLVATEAPDLAPTLFPLPAR